MEGFGKTPENMVQVRHAAHHDAGQIATAAASMMQAMPMVQALALGARVLIKPNLLAKHAPKEGVTTNPHLVAGVILALRQQGVQNILVADSPAGPYTPSIMHGLYEACGMRGVCEELGVPLYTACETAIFPANGKLVRQFTVMHPVLECDLIVNLPKMKTHMMTGITGAAKNLFGCVAGLHKVELHMQFPAKERFGQMLVDLNTCLPPAVHIVDAGLAMEGNGPSGGKLRELNLLFGGQNALTTDLCLCHYMGFPAMQVPYLAAAFQNGLCPASFNTNWLNAASDEAAQLPPAFAQPKSYGNRLDFSRELPPFLRPLMPHFQQWAAPQPMVNKGACIGCGKCVGMCPQKIISLTKGVAHIPRKGCIHCFCCHEVCPAKAIDVKRRRLFRA